MTNEKIAFIINDLIYHIKTGALSKTHVMRQGRAAVAHLKATPDIPQFVKPEFERTCQHDWNTSIIYASNPPKIRCNKCGTYKSVGEIK